MVCAEVCETLVAFSESLRLKNRKAWLPVGSVLPLLWQPDLVSLTSRCSVNV